MMFLFFLARAQQVSCGEITVLTSTKKKVRRVLARKSLPRTNQNSPSAFSHQIRNNSKKDKTKTSQMMGWIENRPNKFLNRNFVRQGLPAKCKTRRFRFISLKFSVRPSVRLSVCRYRMYDTAYWLTNIRLCDIDSINNSGEFCGSSSQRAASVYWNRFFSPAGM